MDTPEKATREDFVVDTKEERIRCMDGEFRLHTVTHIREVRGNWSLGVFDTPAQAEAVIKAMIENEMHR